VIEQRRFSRDLAVGRGTPKLAHTRYSQSGCRAITPGLSLASVENASGSRSCSAPNVCPEAFPIKASDFGTTSSEFALA
jgi:hypothetical protein